MSAPISSPPTSPLPGLPLQEGAQAVPVAIRPKSRLSFWRKLGGGSLMISIIVHSVFLLVGLVWVLAVIPPKKEKVVDFKPSGGGGGGQAAANIRNAKSQQRMAHSAAPRVAALGVDSGFTLPPMEPNSSMSSLGSLSPATGGLGNGGIGGGGFGSGGGKGNGFGTGTGDGMGAGPAGSSNPFGMLSRDPQALVGTFYDLKQTDKRKPTDISNEETLEVIRDFVNKGWRESTLARNYYQAPQKLYQTMIYIPLMPADGAPAAFNCEKEVQPSRWVIVYRGVVTPPKSGKFRFVGAGDDVLVVRFNNRHVFDHGFYGGTTGKAIVGHVPVLKGEERNGYERELKDSPMKIPVSFYQYDTTRNWNDAIGGLAVGPVFEARAGIAYPIEILLSEIPGGLFCASLMLEEIGANYEKGSTSSPILPVFKIGATKLSVKTGDNAPPIDPEGMSWRILQTETRMGF